MGKKSFSATDPASGSGQTNTWLTPLRLIHALGVFDLDPCAFPGHDTALENYTLPECGLILPWFGRVWLNPPYGRNIGIWLEKLEKHGNGVALVFNRTDTAWFQKLRPDAVFFISGRISFERPDGLKAHNAGCGNMFLIYGEENIEAVRKSGILGNLWKSF